MSIGRCECCEATAYLEPVRFHHITLDLCPPCRRRDVIGLLRVAS